MTRTAPVIMLPTNMVPAVCRDMADTASILVLTPSIDEGQVKRLSETLARWAEVTRSAGRTSAIIAEQALALTFRSRLSHAELGELARWMIRRAADLRGQGGTA